MRSYVLRFLIYWLTQLWLDIYQFTELMSVEMHLHCTLNRQLSWMNVRKYPTKFGQLEPCRAFGNFVKLLCPVCRFWCWLFKVGPGRSLWIKAIAVLLFIDCIHYSPSSTSCRHSTVSFMGAVKSLRDWAIVLSPLAFAHEPLLLWQQAAKK